MSDFSLLLKVGWGNSAGDEKCFADMWAVDFFFCLVIDDVIQRQMIRKKWDRCWNISLLLHRLVVFRHPHTHTHHVLQVPQQFKHIFFRCTRLNCTWLLTGWWHWDGKKKTIWLCSNSHRIISGFYWIYKTMKSWYLPPWSLSLRLERSSTTFKAATDRY